MLLWSRSSKPRNIRTLLRRGPKSRRTSRIHGNQRQHPGRSPTEEVLQNWSIYAVSHFVTSWRHIQSLRCSRGFLNKQTIPCVVVLIFYITGIVFINHSIVDSKGSLSLSLLPLQCFSFAFDGLFNVQYFVIIDSCKITMPTEKVEVAEIFLLKST